MAKQPNNSANRGPGRPAFRPTKEQRGFVSVMTGLKMTHDEIASIIINPQTDQPIDKNTLERTFPRELAHGKTTLKSVIGSKFYERLNAGDAWAIQFGFRKIFGWKDGDMNVEFGPDGEKRVTSLTVRFIPPKANGHDTDEELE